MQNNLKDVRWVMGVAAGKGGVGKSTVSTQIAVALNRLGYSVGLMDADVYGPSLCQMLKSDILPSQHTEIAERIIPAVAGGIKMISLAHFQKTGEAAIIRAPLANAVISQFIHKIEWGALDCLVIDFPPGTGDIQLTLMQQARLSGVVIVTTPQEVALLDVKKCMYMIQQMQIPIIGVIENMSYFDLGNGEKAFPLGKGGGRKLASERGVPFIGEVPLHPDISSSGDKGVPLSDSSIFSDLAISIRDYLSSLSESAKEFQLIWDVHNKEESVLLDRPRFPSKDAVFVKSLKQRGCNHFEIEWTDGVSSLYKLADLQRNCPCARCRDEMTGEMLIDPAAIDDDLSAVRLESYGSYALRILFRSGCSQGIYAFSLLRRL